MNRGAHWSIASCPIIITSHDCWIHQHIHILLVIWQSHIESVNQENPYALNVWEIILESIDWSNIMNILFVFVCYFSTKQNETINWSKRKIPIGSNPNYICNQSCAGAAGVASEIESAQQQILLGSSHDAHNTIISDQSVRAHHKSPHTASRKSKQEKKKHIPNKCLARICLLLLGKRGREWEIKKRKIEKSNISPRGVASLIGMKQ